jgi:uncharacterized membrane protein
LAPYGLSALDLVGFGVYAAATLGYHGSYVIYARRHPLRTAKGKVHLYRRTWVKHIVDSGETLPAIHASRNLVMTSSFMASSALLAIAVILNFMVQFDPGDLGLATQGQLLDLEHIRVKLGLLLAILAFGFVAFLQCLRDLNHFTVLVGADKDLIGHVEPVDAVTYLSNLVNRASDRLTYGQRAYLFTIPVIAWLFSATLFLIATVVLLLYVAQHLDFQSWTPPAAFRKESEIL